MHDQNVLQFGKFEFFFSFKLLHSFEVVKTADICFILSVKLKKKNKRIKRKIHTKKKKIEGIYFRVSARIRIFAL